MFAQLGLSQVFSHFSLLFLFSPFRNANICHYMLDVYDLILDYTKS